MIKVIIAGGRDFNDIQFLLQEFKLFVGQEIIEAIISGMARGADTVGIEIAKLYAIPLIQMPADWSKYGKSAGYRRNEEMAQIATHALIAWDGQSKGTGHMLDLAQKYKLVTKVFKY
jgi:hypothetical protein